MILPVSYWKLSEREIVRHYAAISDAVALPIMAYNNPATSGIDMSLELLVEMFNDIDNVTMVKESTGDLTRMLRLSALSDSRFPFYNGSNRLVLDALTHGAAGWCTAAPCLRAQPCLDLYAAVRSGDIQTAQSIYDELNPLLRFIVDVNLGREPQQQLLCTGCSGSRTPGAGCTTAHKSPASRRIDQPRPSRVGTASVHKRGANRCASFALVPRRSPAVGPPPCSYGDAA
jgi:hypothetical protein